MNKKKILVISDHPLSPSGVGHQTKNFIEALLKTGRYKFVCLGGAIKHHSYEPHTVGDWGEDWVIHPVKGYGTVDIVRSILRNDRPDAVWIMTDPRFYEWLWAIDNEIRTLVPLIYYHVWDNYPYPKFNKPYYDSNDMIAAISKVTHDIVQNVSPDVDSVYLPHAVDSNVFKPLSEDVVKKFKAEHMGEDQKDKFIFFWNNRNARRKQSGTLIAWFKEFLDIVGHDKATLLMHTDVRDPHGQDLLAIIKDFGLLDKQVVFSEQKVEPSILGHMYNMVDCTINISDAEGFGLSTLESLSCGTPIIVNMTGGLQEQVTDGKEWFGVGIKPVAKAVIGSLSVPYIHEDRIKKEDFIDAMLKIYNMSVSERKEIGSMGRQHVINNYNFDSYCQRWIEVMDEACEKYGSWETRKGYNRWNMVKI